MNIADLLTNVLTAPSPPQYPNIFCVTIITLLTCNVFLLNSLNLIVTVYVKQEKHISLKEDKPLNLMVLIRKMKLSTFLLYQYSMFRSFVLIMAVHNYFLGCNVFPYLQISKFLRYFFHRDLLLSPVYQSFVII